MPGNPKEVKLKGFSGFPETDEIITTTSKPKVATKPEQKASKKSKFRENFRNNSFH